MYITNEAADPRIIEMLEALTAGQQAEVTRDAVERDRDMTAEADLRALAAETNDFTNRLAASTAGIAADLAALKDMIAQGTVTPEATALLTSAIANLGSVTSGLEAVDSGFPVPTPTPTPAPEDTTTVPPVEEAPGTTEIPTDSGDGSGAGGTGDGAPV